MKCKNKIIAIVSALVITINCLCVPASALGGVDIGNYIGGYSQAVGDSIAEFWTTIGEIVKGNITFSEAKDSLIENANNFGNDLLVNYITNVDCETLVDQTAFIRDLLDLTLEVGDGITDLVKDLLNINGVTGKPEFDYSGASAGLVVEERGWTYYYKINNGVIHKYADRMVLTGDSVHYEAFGPLGEFNSSDVLTYVSKEYNSSVKFYGSWKLIDYTKDTEEVVDYGGSDLLPPTLDDATDEQLLELLYDLIDQLNLAFPDLSTVEGLLRAILVQCVSINGKLDGSGSGNIDDIQIMLDMSIASLMANNDENSTALLDELIGIREDLASYFNRSDGEEVTEEEVQDDNFLTDIISRLTSCLSLFNISLFEIPSIEDVRELGPDGVKLLIKTVDLIVSVSSSIPLKQVNNLIGFMQTIMFNDAAPADLTFNLTIMGQTSSYTLLSASLLEKNGFADALIIVRTLSGFILIYIWLKWVRRYLISFV